MLKFTWITYRQRPLYSLYNKKISCTILISLCFVGKFKVEFANYQPVMSGGKLVIGQPSLEQDFSFSIAQFEAWEKVKIDFYLSS